MQPILFLWMMTIVLVNSAMGQGMIKSPTNVEIEKTIINIENEKDSAMQTRDVAVLDRIYADDLIFVNARGELLTKAQRMNEFQTANVKYLSFDQGDYHFYIYGDTVVLTGRANSVVNYHGTVNRIPRRFTSTYIKTNGQWRLVAHQATLISEEVTQHFSAGKSKNRE